MKALRGKVRYNDKFKENYTISRDNLIEHVTGKLSPGCYKLTIRVLDSCPIAHNVSVLGSIIVCEYGTKIDIHDLWMTEKDCSIEYITDKYHYTRILFEFIPTNGNPTVTLEEL